MRHTIYGIIGLLLLCLVIYFQIRCIKLANALDKAQIEILNQSDSIDFINKQHIKTIKLYEAKISELNIQIDSLDNIKQQIIIRKDDIIVSDNISDAVLKLKENLSIWKD